MGKSPLSLWRDGGTAEPRGLRPLEGTWRDLFAQVYGGLARVGISPPVVDSCEIWEVAAMLGCNEPAGESDGVSDWNAARAFALEHGLPEPEWPDEPVVNPTDVPFLAEGLILPP